MARRRNAEALTFEQRSSLRALVGNPKFELIPLSNALEVAAGLPPASTVSVTASPSHGIEATIEVSEALASNGHEPIPHLSAHMIRDRGHLGEILDRCAGAGLRRTFVVGGDGRGPGTYPDGLSLLRAMDEIGHPFDEIGIASYPKGHANIPDDVLLRALKDKQPYARYMTTQMCFEPRAIASWIARVRGEGITLAVNLGVPGVAELAKIMMVAKRIGVADSARYLKKNRKIVGHIVRGRFGPDELLEELASTLADPVADVRAIHLFTFNQIGATVEWRRRMLAELDDDHAEEADV